jgi:hypothetical protein
MKTRRTNSGPFSEQPYYKIEEIEQTCTEELLNEGLLPVEPSEIRIERFIEKRFKISPRYEELPEGCLGYTEFGPKGVKAIVIASSLADENSKASERRVNTTLAHEIGHGLLHAHLFVFGKQPKLLFGDSMDSERPRILCRKSDVPVGDIMKSKNHYDGRWWEYQANLAIGPLLLPRVLVNKALESFFVETGSLGGRTIDRVRINEAVNVLSEIFNVNPIVAKIRLEALFPADESRQLTL